MADIAERQPDGVECQEFVRLRRDLKVGSQGPQGPISGDYRWTGGRVPKKFLLGGRKRKRPPTIATFSKQKLNFFSILTTILVYCIFP